MNFESFQCNLLPSVAKGYQEYFNNSPNIIGSSSIPFGLRSNVIFKRNGLEKEQTMEMLAGKIMEYPLKKPKFLYYATKEINKNLGYIEKEINGNRFIELTNGKYLKFFIPEEKSRFIEILPEKYFRYTPDIETSLYNIEIKTTSMPKNMWGELAPYNIMQLNANMGFLRHEFGFLLKVDLNFIKSKSESWDFIWNKYFMLYPVNFDPSLFNYTIEKTKTYFKLLDSEQDLSKINCPEFPTWECKDCAGKKYCPSPISILKIDTNEKCEYCKQEIRAGSNALLRKDKTYCIKDENGIKKTDCIMACRNNY